MGFYLDSKDKTCYSCSINCRKCANSTSCTICAIGFGNINGTCNKCNDQLCVNCDGNSNICLECNIYGSLSFTINLIDKKCYLKNKTTTANNGRFGCSIPNYYNN